MTANDTLADGRRSWRVAVVTPYYKEERSILTRCRDSVLRQSYPCDHVVVADGSPSEIFEQGPRTLHVKLPQANADNGNTPRAIGGILADAYGYDAVAYLDADNWFEDNHIENLIAAHERSKAPLVCCKRKFYDLDGTFMDITEPAEERNEHVDTSCWIVFRPAFSLLRAWLMPKILGPVCDRIFLQKVMHDRFQIERTTERTVCFTTQYALHYKLARRPVPAGAKSIRDAFVITGHFRSRVGAKEIISALGFVPDLSIR